ncbi:MAG: alkaline phosphatase D family protein [Candidatus Cyclobacteriaceae bacterium M3_2C_046]
MYKSFFLLFAIMNFMHPLWSQQVYFTTGFKVAEVTDQSAIIWTRLCASATRNPIIHERKATVFRHPIDFNEEMPVEQMDGYVAGHKGLVKVTLFHGTNNISSEWISAQPEQDYTVHIPFNDLNPGTFYQFIIEGKASANGPVNAIAGNFKTAPSPDSIAPVLLTTSTCQYFWSYDDEQAGFKTYLSMSELNPDFYMQTGDYIYYDKPGPLAKNKAEARHKWHAMDSWPSLIRFYQHTPIYMTKDDHDLLSDDAHPGTEPYGALTYQEGLNIWRENAPLAGKPYRTFRWGKDLQIWLMEGREYRTPNQEKDHPGRTIWGQEQKDWLEQTLSQSDATFKLLVSPTPIVGPDRDNKNDNYANETYNLEGQWARDLLSGQKGLFVVNGDRHWQYVSQDAQTGLIEFGSGPVSDAHAQGWKPEDKRPTHRYLRVKGGFLAIQVVREDKIPVITFTHYNVDGRPMHQEKFSRENLN